MTDEQKLKFLITELKLLANQKHCYDGRKGDDLYYYSDDHDSTFDDGSKYGLVSFARSILESMGETYE
jgi:hypothetical protein